MKRVSPLNNIGINSRKPTRSSKKHVIPVEIMQREVKLKKMSSPGKLNFYLLYKRNCDPNGEIIESRRSYAYRIARKFDLYLKDHNSVDSVYGRLSDFRKYIRFCDTNNLDPLSKQGYRAVFGNAGELRRLIKLQNEKLNHLFLYQDGDEVGISSSTAITFNIAIRHMLSWCGVFNGSWDVGISKFKTANKNSYKPYSESEQNKVICRLTNVFFDLHRQLIEFNEHQLLPDNLMVKLEINGSGEPTFINIKSKNTNGNISYTSPFNRVMQLGYLLFSYYTSFNTSPILDVRHPIDNISKKKENRTIKYASVRGFKARSNKTVQALFSNYSSIDDIPIVEPDSKEDGAIITSVDKKDGLKFINAIVELSKKFQTKEHGKLFYLLDRDGKIRPLNTSHIKVPQLLGLFSDNRNVTTDWFIECFTLLFKEGKLYAVSAPNNNLLGRVVSKKKIVVGNKNQALVYLGYCAIRSMTDIDLKNVILPLSYGNSDDNGNFELSFFYFNKHKAKVTFQSKYKRFIKSFEKFVSTINSIDNSSIKTPYLFPLGIGVSIKNFQWDGLELVKEPFLKKLGVFSGDYYLELNTSRFRKTTADEEFNPSDSGYEASIILNNQLETFHQNYSNGHPQQNKVIQSQGLQILEEHSFTQDLELAKSNVKLRLNIEVLEYEQWKELRIPTNINGVLCDGNPDLINGDNQHRSALKLAQDLLSDNSNEPKCYQYDQCVYCKSARLVNDIHSVYKFLSFIEVTRQLADRIPQKASVIEDKANYLRSVLEQSVSIDVLEKAEDKLFIEGPYQLLTEDHVYMLIGDYSA